MGDIYRTASMAGPYSFLAAAAMKKSREDPELFLRYCKDIIELFNTLIRYDSFAKIFDQAYASSDFSKVAYNSSDLETFRSELSPKIGIPC